MNESHDSDARPPSPEGFALAAVTFEVALGVVAVLLGRWIGYDPLQHLRFEGPLVAGVARQVGWGLAATLPMLAGAILLDRYPWGPIKHLRWVLHRRILPLFQHMDLAGLAVISLAAGAGEELLFRGLVQAGLTSWWGPEPGFWWALLVASVLFGLCHWLTRTYALLAALIGVYLGLLYWFTGNLLAPIITHALYDLGALYYMTRFSRGASVGLAEEVEEEVPQR